MSLTAQILLHTYFGQATSLMAQSPFSQEGVSVTTLLIGGGVLIAVVAAAWVAYQHLNPNATKNCPKRLFRDLCRKHKLVWSERSLLKKLAQSHQLATTAEIFVSPYCFEVGDSRAQQTLLQQIDDLREKLFGSGASK